MVTGANTSPQPDPAPTLRKSENRRSNKPIMEKRRRARINNCLNELKSLILDAMKKDPARHNKLEKADILEMTVKHLETMQRQQVALAAATDPKVVDKFRAGFRECAGEVGRFPGLEPPVRKRLLQHLSSCLTPDENQPVQVNLVGDQGVLLTSGHGDQGVLLPAGQLQVVPTRLPNGDIALVLPSRRPPSPPPLTALTPSPPSTPSLSPLSTPPLSPPPSSHPISLVLPKTSPQPIIHDDHWRPWM